MFCPLCKVEHREGFTRCLECDVDLVKELPAEQKPEYENLVAVFEGDSISAAMALTVIRSAGIESWTRDEEVHSLFPSLGLSQVLVREEDAKMAVKALDTPETDRRQAHNNSHSSSRHSLDTSDAHKRCTSGDRAENSRKSRSKPHETPATSHHDNCSRRHGKRV